MSLQKGYLTQYEDVYDLPGRVYDTSEAVYGDVYVTSEGVFDTIGGCL